jgi:hypothetical protein
VGGDDPDDDDNTDSNGLDDGAGGVTTLAVTLTSGSEPTNDGDGNEFTNLSIDFGFWINANIGDRVWYDTDQDGIQDASETGVPGVTVYLLDAGGNVIASTVTNGQGYYRFEDIPPGDYAVQFAPPAGYSISPQDAGGNDGADSDADPLTGTTTTISLDPGENDLTWDMGLHLMGAVPASLGNYVWFDVDQDGVQDAGETGVAGVVVQLYDATEKLIAETVTDANGDYLFGNLAPGEYYVQFIPPYSYVISGQNLGGAADDSDGNPVTGWTAVVNLQAGENDPTWDLGIYQYTPTALPEESEPVMDVRFYLSLVSSHYPLDAAAESVLVPEGTAAPEWAVQLYLPAVQGGGFALATAEEGALSAPVPEGTAPVTPTLEATPLPEETAPVTPTPETTPTLEGTAPVTPTLEATPLPEGTAPVTPTLEATPLPEETAPVTPTLEATPLPEGTEPVTPTLEATPTLEPTEPAAATSHRVLWKTVDV